MARAAALAVVLLTASVVLAALASEAQARLKLGWQRPGQLAPPIAALDVFGTQAAISAQGTTAVGYGVTNVDTPAAASAFNLTRAGSGKVSGPNPISDAKQVLAIGWRGRTEMVLTGSAGSQETCCTTAEASLASGRAPHTIITGLAGATDGRLIPVSGGLLAVVGTDAGVWAAQSDARGRFGPTHKLGNSAVVGAIDSIAAPANTTVTGWATASSPAVWIARGSAKAAPASGRAVISVASGHSIDDFALAPAPGRAGGATAVWVESWSDSRANFHSVVMAADLTGALRRRQLSSGRELAASLAVAGDSGGDQAVAWKGCTSSGTCAVRATLRPAGVRFGSIQNLGAIDASESPALAVSEAGETVLGWIGDGHVLAANAPLGARRLSRAHTVSNTNFATDLGVTFGQGTTAVATWTQGTLAQTLMGAVYVGR